MKNHTIIKNGAPLAAKRQPRHMPKISVQPPAEIFIPACADEKRQNGD